VLCDTCAIRVSRCGHHLSRRMPSRCRSFRVIAFIGFAADSNVHHSRRDVRATARVDVARAIIIGAGVCWNFGLDDGRAHDGQHVIVYLIEVIASTKRRSSLKTPTPHARSRDAARSAAASYKQAGIELVQANQSATRWPHFEAAHRYDPADASNLLTWQFFRLSVGYHAARENARAACICGPTIRRRSDCCAHWRPLMLNYIWSPLMAIALVVSAINGTAAGVTRAPSIRRDRCRDRDRPHGVMTLWLGIMRIAEKAGLISALGRVLRPFSRCVSRNPGPTTRPSGAMILNIAQHARSLERRHADGHQGDGELQELIQTRKRHRTRWSRS